MKIVVIDDEVNCRILLKNKILKYDSNANIVGEANGVVTGMELIQKEHPDLVFLDIQMNDGTGFDLLNKLDFKAFNIIFTTAFDQYAIKAFKYAAIDYLLKPINYRTLSESLDRIELSSVTKNRFSHLVSSYTDREFDTIYLKTEDNMHEVKLSDIESVKAQGSYCTFHLKENIKILISKPLKEYCDLLPPIQFVRTHKSFLINLDMVKTYRLKSSLLVLSSGDLIPVSRRNKMNVFDTISKLPKIELLKNV